MRCIKWMPFKRIYTACGILLILLLLFVCAPAALAVDSETDTSGDGWSYEDGVLTITSNTGIHAFFKYEFEQYHQAEPTGFVKPHTAVFAESVTEIRCALEWETVVIPSTVHYIAPNSVYSIGNVIKHITVSPDNPYFYVENGMLIERETATVMYVESNLVHAVVPDGIRHIGNAAFAKLDGLKSIVLPEGLLSIGIFAFEGCTNLQLVKMPPSLRAILAGAFSQCTGLSALVIPPNVRFYGSSGHYAVMDGTALNTLVFCDNHIPDSGWIFGYCSWPKRLVFLDDPPIDWGLGTRTHRLEHLDTEEIASATQMVIYYREAHRKAWAPNGETEWNGYPIRMLTGSEEEEIRTLAGDAWDAAWIDEDNAPLMGWSLDANGCLRVYTDEGFAFLARNTWSVEETTAVVQEGVTVLPSRGLSPISTGNIDEVTLPASLRVIEKGALDRVNEVRLAAGNAQYYMENGALYERATGTMVWEQWKATSAEETPVSTPVSSPAQAQDDPPDNGWSHEDGVLTLTLDIWRESLPPYLAYGYWYTAVQLDDLIPVDVLVIGPELKLVPRLVKASDIRVDPDNPWYYAENGMLIERETAKVVLAAWDLVDAVVPKGVLAIGENAFDNHEALRSVTFPEDLREIHEDAFYACNNLMHVALPESLTAVFSNAFFYCGFTELVLPPNVHFYLDIDGQGSPYNWSNIETLVVTDANINLWEREIMWTMPLKRLIFLCEPPAGFEGYDFEEMRKKLRQEYSARNYEPDIAVCYLPEMAGAWTPNGETKWNGFQLRPLTEREVAEVKKLCGPLWGAKRREWDEAAYPGWSLDENRHMTVYSDAGLEAVTSFTYMCPKSLTLCEGVTSIPEGTGMLFDWWLEYAALPSTISHIETGSLRSAEEVRLSKENPYFEWRDGKLYERATGTMVWEKWNPSSAEETPMAAQTPAPTPVLSPTPTAAPAAVAGDEPSLFTRFIRAMTPLFLLLAIRTVFACALAVYCLQRRTGKRRRT